MFVQRSAHNRISWGALRDDGLSLLGYRNFNEFSSFLVFIILIITS